jgi:signal transduction histidine kinase
MLYVAVPITAQTIIQTPAQADSLRRVIATAKHDTTRIKVMNELAAYLCERRNQYDSAMIVARKANDEAEHLGFHRGAETALRIIGVVFWRQGKYKEALEFYFKSLHIREELGDKLGIAKSLINIAIVYRNLGKYTEALEYNFKSLRIVEELDDKLGIATSLNNIGIVYNNLGKQTEALEYYFKSLRVSEKLGNKSFIAATLTNIGNAYKDKGKYTEAIEYHSKSQQIEKETNHKFGLAGSIGSIGDIYLKMNQFRQAQPYLFECLRLQQELGKTDLTGILLSIAESYRGQGKFDSARAFSLRSLVLADSLGVKLRVQEALEELAIISDSLGRHKESLAYFKRYMTVKDSLINLENLNKTSALKEGYEAEKREQQIALLNTDKALQESKLTRAAIERQAQEKSILLLNNEKQVRELTLQQQEAALTEAHLREERNTEALKLYATELQLENAELDRRNAIQWSLAGFLVVSLAGAVWLGSLYRHKNKANKAIVQQQQILEDQAIEIQQANIELLQQNEVLTTLNVEKNEFMGIAAHDLKNPLASIRLSAEMLLTYIGRMSEENLSKRLQSIISVSDQMTTIISNLLDINQLESGGIQLNMVSFDISPLVESVVYQYRTPAETKHITIHFNNDSAENIVCTDEQALMQVLDNLVSNAVKYSPHGKEVFVRILSNEAVVRIEIQDEGEGISEEEMKKLFGKFVRLSARPTGGEHSTGLGLSIVKRMVEAMDGRVWCESKVGKGATFIVEFPSAA